MEPLRLAQVDLNLLFTLRVFVESRGLAAAARKLGRSQPAVSARLHQLEEQLGIALFEKVGRRLELTAAGHAIYDEVRGVVAGLQKVVDRVRAVGMEPYGTLRLGTLPTVSAYLLSAPLARFLERYPRARVQLEHGLNPLLEAKLREGELDMVVSIGEPPTGRLELSSWQRVRPVAALAGERRRQGKPLPLRDLREMEYIAYGEVEDPFFGAVTRFVRRHRLGSRMRVSHIQTVKELVRAGAGTSLLPDYTLVEPGLHGRAVQGLSASFPVWIATRPGASTIPLVGRFRDMVLASKA